MPPRDHYTYPTTNSRKGNLMDAPRDPDALIWDMPTHCQGQIIEVSYADEQRGSTTIHWRRVFDRSTNGPAVYHRLPDKWSL